MIKQEITFKDLDDNDVTQVFWFHIYKHEALEMELSRPGGLMAYLKKIGETEDASGVLEIFRMFITKSYGERSEDNTSFLKTPEKTAWFLGTDAYNKLFLKFIEEPKWAADFIIGMVPKEFQQKLATEFAEKSDNPTWVIEKRKPTRDEMKEIGDNPKLLQLAMKFMSDSKDDETS